MIQAKRVAFLALSTLLALSLTGCTGDGEGEEGGEAGTVTVTRGDIVVDVAASGNLAFSTQEDLAFEMAGTVEDISVEIGDSVTEGQVVAILDTSNWEDQLRALRTSVLSAEIGLEQSEYALEQAEAETMITITGDVVVRECCDDEDIAIKEKQVEMARQRLEDAQADLDEALALSPEIVVPFDGFVTHVNVEGGDEVMKGHVAVTIADPEKFEALILVSENDILQVAEGTQARVSVDAQSGVILPAEVTDVAPTASIQSGVVNYEVTVDVASLDEVAAQMEERLAQGYQQSDSDEMQERLKEALESGEITEEELAAMQEAMQSRQSTQPPVAMFESIQLREGLTVTVTLIVAEKTDVLLIPNAAISSTAGRTTVTVIAEDETEDERQIVTGVSNWQYTEVVDGLEEGDVLKIPEGAMATGEIPESRQGGLFMGGPPH